MTKKIYITFCNSDNVWNKKLNYAIECSNAEDAIKVGMDINSCTCFKNVRMNRCSRLKKGTKVLSSNSYRYDFDGDNSFAD